MVEPTGTRGGAAVLDLKARFTIRARQGDEHGPTCGAAVNGAVNHFADGMTKPPWIGAHIQVTLRVEHQGQSPGLRPGPHFFALSFDQLIERRRFGRTV